MLKIREIRKARGLTMKQLRDMVGALKSSISFYERGFSFCFCKLKKRKKDC